MNFLKNIFKFKNHDHKEVDVDHPIDDDMTPLIDNTTTPIDDYETLTLLLTPVLKKLNSIMDKLNGMDFEKSACDDTTLTHISNCKHAILMGQHAATKQLLHILNVNNVDGFKRNKQLKESIWDDFDNLNDKLTYLCSKKDNLNSTIDDETSDSICEVSKDELPSLEPISDCVDLKCSFKTPRKKKNKREKRKRIHRYNTRLTNKKHKIRDVKTQ